MADHNILGNKGEKLALSYLKEEGYEILETNWRFKRAEVDIIAKKENWIIITEVKTRTSELYGGIAEAITTKKMKMLCNAAEAYVLQNDLENEIRFDLIFIIQKGNSHSIQHIKEAFYPFASEMDDD